MIATTTSAGTPNSRSARASDRRCARRSRRRLRSAPASRSARAYSYHFGGSSERTVHRRRRSAAEAGCRRTRARARGVEALLGDELVDERAHVGAACRSRRAASAPERGRRRCALHARAAWTESTDSHRGAKRQQRLREGRRNVIIEGRRESTYHRARHRMPALSAVPAASVRARSGGRARGRVPRRSTPPRTRASRSSPRRACRACPSRRWASRSPIAWDSPPASTRMPRISRAWRRSASASSRSGR